MRRRRIGLLAAILAVAVAVMVLPGAKPAGGEIWLPPNWTFTVEGAFQPRALPKKEPAPISLFLAGGIGSQDVVPPPPLGTFEVEGDKHVAIDVRGLPTCAWKDLRSASTAQARRVCGGSLVGSGKVGLAVLFPETPVPAKSEMLVLNGGFRGGVTTLFLHAHIDLPIPTTLVAPVKIRKIDRGRYGLRAIASIPKFAGGDGLIESFSLKIEKGILTATCTDRRLQAAIALGFVDRTKIEGTLFGPCTPKG